MAAFGDLCASLFTGNKKSEVDPTRFAVTKITEKNAREIKPDVKGPLWDVSGTKSDVHMLVHYEPAGLCAVEVAEAERGRDPSRVPGVGPADVHDARIGRWLFSARLLLDRMAVR